MAYPPVLGYPDQALIDWSAIAHGPRDMALRCPVSGCGLQVGWQHRAESYGAVFDAQLVSGGHMRVITDDLVDAGGGYWRPDPSKPGKPVSFETRDEIVRRVVEQFTPEEEDALFRRLARNPGMTCEGCYRASMSPLPEHAPRGAAYRAWFNRPDVTRERVRSIQKAHFTSFLLARELVLKDKQPTSAHNFMVAFAVWSYSQLNRASRRAVLEIIEQAGEALFARGVEVMS